MQIFCRTTMNYRKQISAQERLITIEKNVKFAADRWVSVNADKIVEE